MLINLHSFNLYLIWIKPCIMHLRFYHKAEQPIWIYQLIIPKRQHILRWTQIQISLGILQCCYIIISTNLWFIFLLFIFPWCSRIALQKVNVQERIKKIKTITATFLLVFNFKCFTQVLECVERCVVQVLHGDCSDAFVIREDCVLENGVFTIAEHKLELDDVKGN